MVKFSLLVGLSVCLQANAIEVSRSDRESWDEARAKAKSEVSNVETLDDYKAVVYRMSREANRAAESEDLENIAFIRRYSATVWATADAEDGLPHFGIAGLPVDVGIWNYLVEAIHVKMIFWEQYHGGSMELPNLVVEDESVELIIIESDYEDYIKELAEQAVAAIGTGDILPLHDVVRKIVLTRVEVPFGEARDALDGMMEAILFSMIKREWYLRWRMANPGDGGAVLGIWAAFDTYEFLENGRIVPPAGSSIVRNEYHEAIQRELDEGRKKRK